MKTLILFLILNLFNSCSNKDEKLIHDIHELISNEKYELAKSKIKKRLSDKRYKAEIISDKKTDQPRLLEMSNDRTKVTWSEDRLIYYMDLNTHVIKKKELYQPPEVFSISYDSKYITIISLLADESGCRLNFTSLLEPRNIYQSESNVSCEDKGGVSFNGKFLYYFMEENLYSEEIGRSGSVKLVLKKDKFPSPFNSIENKYFLSPIAETFLLFAGNAGAYNLYWFNPGNSSIELLSKDIATPQIFNVNSSISYIIHGQIGNYNVFELNYKTSEKPSLKDKFSIKENLYSLWETNNKDQFIALKGDQLVEWSPIGDFKRYPLFCKRILGVSYNHIFYENKKGKLILTELEFSKEEWYFLELYDKIDKKL